MYSRPSPVLGQVKGIRPSDTLPKTIGGGLFLSTILSETLKSGGMTIHIPDGERPISGFAVSTLKSEEYQVKVTEFSESVISSYIESKSAFLSQPDIYLGTWVNEGMVYLDLICVVPEKTLAISLAREHNQKAIYDLTRGEEIPTSKE